MKVGHNDLYLRSGVQGKVGLRSEFQASEGDIVRLTKRTKSKPKHKQIYKNGERTRSLAGKREDILLCVLGAGNAVFAL